VIARTAAPGADATLTVLGHSNDATHTQFQFNLAFTVLASFADTKVVRRGLPIAFDLDDVNVGQHVRVFGALSGTTLDASAPTDVIRMEPTRVYGYANGAISGTTLAMDLNRVGQRPESVFTWTDGGSTPPDPDAFSVAVGNLGNGLGVGAGVPVEARGYFAAIDDAAEDFVASSLTNLANAAAKLRIHDVPVFGLAVTTSTSPAQVEFAIVGSPVLGEVAVVDQGFAGPVPLPASPAPTVGAAMGPKFYLTIDKDLGTVSVDLTFVGFSTGLGNALAQGAFLRRFDAVGGYDAASNSMNANLIVAVLDS
jgi:hypothetical protein